MKILFFSDFLSDFFSKTIRNIREGDDFEFFFPISWDWSAKIYSLQVEPKNWIRQKISIIQQFYMLYPSHFSVNQLNSILNFYLPYWLKSETAHDQATMPLLTSSFS